MVEHNFLKQQPIKKNELIEKTLGHHHHRQCEPRNEFRNWRSYKLGNFNKSFTLNYCYLNQSFDLLNFWWSKIVFDQTSFQMTALKSVSDVGKRVVVEVSEFADVVLDLAERQDELAVAILDRDRAIAEVYKIKIYFI